MRIRQEICWITLLVVGLTAIVSPCSILAQVEKDGLTLNIVFDSFRSITAGEERTIFLEVRNTGYEELTNIQLTADSPEGWTVDFNPGVIDKLAPGGLQTVDIRLKPADNATKGDYNIAVIAQANEMRRVASIYVRVKSASLFWVWVGIGIAAVLIAGFAVIFMRYGREEK